MVQEDQPLNQLTEPDLKNITQFAEQLDQRYSNSNSATAHKLKLMAAMTKAVIEYDVSRLLDGTTDQGYLIRHLHSFKSLKMTLRSFIGISKHI